MISLKVNLKKRTRGRLLAINSLYRHELLGDDPLKIIEKEGKGEEKEIAMEYLKKILPNLGIIDEFIRKHLKGWDFERVLPFEKSILRFGTGEILLYPETPLPVIIEELLKIANIFAGEKTVKFINGVLDKVGKELRK
jgi:N utilization substance protein B